MNRQNNRTPEQRLARSRDLSLIFEKHGNHYTRRRAQHVTALAAAQAKGVVARGEMPSLVVI